MQLGKDEYVYKTKGMNIFFGIKDKQMYATNDELLYKNVGKAADKSIKDAPYASDMKGKTIFVAINAEAIHLFILDTEEYIHAFCFVDIFVLTNLHDIFPSFRLPR